jgi:ATP/ADP translocase
MIAASTFVLYRAKLTQPDRILKISLGSAIILCATAGLITLLHPSIWFWFCLKICSRALFGILLACAWTFTDFYHDLQNATRVYALYSAIYFLGSICAGIMINTALDILGSTGLLIIAALALFLALAEVRKISLTPPLHGVYSFPQNSTTPSFSLVRLIGRSPFTISLLLLSLLTQLLIIISEYSYMDSFGRIFQTISIQEGGSENALVEFLGKCRAWISGCNILIGLFFYGRFTRRIGLNNVILISPLFFLMVYSEWILYDTLMIAILGLIAVDGVRFTIEDNCFNLLSKAVPDTLKPKVRIINDSFFEPIGMLLSALLLFGMQSASRWIGLVLSLVALAAALVLRELYNKATKKETTH